MEKLSEAPQLPNPTTRNQTEVASWIQGAYKFVVPYLRALAYRVNRLLPKDGTEAMTAPLPLMTYTVATLPAAADWPDTIVYVTDGATPGIYQSTGAAWVAVYAPSLAGYVPTSRTITTQYSITGGGDLTANRTLNLVNDAASPGNSMYYGTDSSGTRGWFASFAPVGVNVLINGGCEVWQRGAGGSASIAVAASTTAYTMDRAYIITAANQASTISQQAGLTNNSRFCARVQRNNGQTGTGAMLWAMPLTTEQVTRLRGSKAVISFVARKGANFSPTSGNLTATLYVGTGAEGKRGGGFTGETNVVSATNALSSSATAYSAVSSSTVPTNAAQGELSFTWTPTGTASTNDYFEIDDIQIEANTVATSFERRSFWHDFLLCLPFYEKSFDYAIAPAQNTASFNGAYGARNQTGSVATVGNWAHYQCRKRVNPSVTSYNPHNTNANWRNAGDSGDFTFTLEKAGEQGFFATATSVNANTTAYVHYSADAEL